MLLYRFLLIASRSPTKHLSRKKRLPPGTETENSPADSTAETSKASDKNSPAISYGDYLSGRFAASSGDNKNGIQFLRESLKRDPDNKEILANLYHMLIAAGQAEEAIPVARKLAGTKLSDEDSEFMPELLLTLDEAKQQHYEAAEKYLQAVPKSGFNSLLVPLLQEWLKLGKGDIKAPVEVKDILPGSKMVLPHVYLNAAYINDIAGFEEKAQEQYELATKDNRIETFRAAEALVNFYDRKSISDKRDAFVKDYTASHGESFIESIPANSNAKPLVADVTEGLAETLYTVANIFHGVRAPADEITTLRLALYLRPNFPAAEFLLGNAYELTNDYKNSINSYKMIDTKSPYYFHSQILIAYDESELGNKETALHELDILSNEKPNEITALLTKGDILRAKSNYKEAIENYDQALARVKEARKPHWRIYFSRGTCYESLGQFDKAEADMKTALSLDPGEPDILNYLGYSWLIQHRNIPEARKMIEDAYDARPEDPNIIDSMGYAFYVDGDYTSAEEYFEQTLERTPNDPTVNEHLGDTYWQLGRKTEARFQWNRALTNKPSAENEKELHKKLENGIPLIKSTHVKNTTEVKKSPPLNPESPVVQ